jgi:hypothetical protein
MNNILNLENYFTDNNGRYHSVYLLTYNPILKYYIGKHSGNLHPSMDSYVCSTSNENLTQLLDTEPHNFTREILRYFSSEDEAASDECDRLPLDYNYSKLDQTYFNLVHPSLRFGNLSREDRLEVNKKSRTTNLKKYGHVMGTANLPGARKKIGEISKRTKKLRYGGAMSRCHTSKSISKRCDTLTKKFGNPCGQMHTPEVRVRVDEKNRLKSYKISMKGTIVSIFNSWGEAVIDHHSSGCSRDWIHTHDNPEFIYLKDKDILTKDEIISSKVSRSTLIISEGNKTLYYRDSKFKRYHELAIIRNAQRLEA